MEWGGFGTGPVSILVSPCRGRREHASPPEIYGVHSLALLHDKYKSGHIDLSSAAAGEIKMDFWIASTLERRPGLESCDLWYLVSGRKCSSFNCLSPWQSLRHPMCQYNSGPNPDCGGVLLGSMPSSSCWCQHFAKWICWLSKCSKFPMLCTLDT